MEEWQKVFGVEFQAVLVFAYWLQGPPQYSPFTDLHWFRKRHYGFVGIGLLDYTRMATPRSEKWQTVSAAGRDFSRAARPIEEFL
ncbi:MAG: HYExAFE family protein [Phycisphaerae bacterium]